MPDESQNFLFEVYTPTKVYTYMQAIQRKIEKQIRRNQELQKHGLITDSSMEDLMEDKHNEFDIKIKKKYIQNLQNQLKRNIYISQ